MDYRKRHASGADLDYETSEDIPANPSTTPTMGDIVGRRLGRRDLLQGALAVTAISAVAVPALTLPARQARAGTANFVFDELERGIDGRHHVAQGYSADVLIRWGDPVRSDAAAFDPADDAWAPISAID